ncbi:hypothetical protein CDL15_Pgr020920 [Punica granatum]|uniref:Uncharacterized protein n=1 Tax=Punica granatum TaxID=22663 RepID=A0A218XWF0_PUNGR|nr:hypothetical protein CDL15_Pgr020920 [Punica granatum]
MSNPAPQSSMISVNPDPTSISDEFLGDLISEKGKVPLSFELGEDEEGRNGVTSSDDDWEIATKVKEARPGAQRQPRSASKGVVQAVLKVQGSRKSMLGKGGKPPKRTR